MMKPAGIVVLVAGVALAAASRTANTAEQAGAPMKNAKGESVGTVTPRAVPQGTLLHATLTNLPAGAAGPRIARSVIRK